jgi:hypothetical protein
MTYVDMTPSWETAVTIYMAVLENPNASKKVRQAARDDILKLARTVDNNRIVSPDDLKRILDAGAMGDHA